MTALARHAFSLIFLLALLLRLGYLAETYDTPVWRWHNWSQSDMDTFLKVADQIRGGDVLVQRPYHPYHLTHKSIGSREQWRVWLGGDQVFYHVPGYYYFLALLLKLSAGSVLVVKLVQALLGAGHAALLGLVGAKLLGRPAGVVTGFLAALYGPFIAGEAMLLREGPGNFLAAAGLFFVWRAREATVPADPHHATRSWLAAGALLGIGGLMKETGVVLFGAIWLWAFAHSVVGRNPLPKRVPWLLLVGFLITLSPLVVRNVIVGAPAFALSPQLAYSFALANVADNPSGGALFYNSVPGVPGIMERSNGRTLEAIRLTLLTYEGKPWQILVNWWARFTAIWSNVETPDNFSYAYLVTHSALLRALPEFVCIWLPAVLGLALLGWQTLRRQRDVPAAQNDAWASAAPKSVSLILACLTVQALLVSLNTVVSRYRLIILPCLILLAGWTLAQAVLWIQHARWKRIAGLSAALVCLSLIWWIWPSNRMVQAVAIRPVDFLVATSDLLQQGDLAGVRHELEQGIFYCFNHAAGTDQSREVCAQTLREAWLKLSGTFDRSDHIGASR